MTEWLGMPPLAAAHGGQIDSLIGWIHVFMFILFIGWGGFFLYCLVRFRRSANPVADYTGVTSPASKYSEIAVAVIEGVLLVGFAIPLWAARVEHVPSASEALIVQVTGEQFAWNVHYAGPDGVFGRTDIKLLDLQSNPLGLDRDDPAAKDDVTTLNQLYLPVNKPVVVRLRSKDVIHSFGVPEFRVKQDAIPGLDDPDLVRPHRHDRGDADAVGQARVPVRDRLRAALRPGSRPDAGIRHRPDRRGVPDVAGYADQGAERTGSLPVVRATRWLGKVIMQTLLQHARRLVCLTVLAVLAAPPLAAQSLPYESMAARIVTALQVSSRRTRTASRRSQYDGPTRAARAEGARSARRGGRDSPVRPGARFRSTTRENGRLRLVTCARDGHARRPGARPATLDRQRSWA